MTTDFKRSTEPSCGYCCAKAGEEHKPGCQGAGDAAPAQADKGASSDYDVKAEQAYFDRWPDHVEIAAPAQRGMDAGEREEFEKIEAASQLSRDDDGDYLNPFVQSAWEGWQARATLAAQSVKVDAAVCHAPVQVPSDDLPADLALLRVRLRSVEQELTLRRQCDIGDVWYWQGDGGDHIESMGNAMAVVIRADQLRAVLASRAPQSGAAGAVLSFDDWKASAYTAVLEKSIREDYEPKSNGAQANAAGAVPVAWLHDQEGRVDVIHDDVKKLWIKVGQPKGFYREKVPCRVEHYTIPLYAAPAATPKGDPIYQMRQIAGGDWVATDADEQTALRRMPHWKGIFEFRTLYTAPTAAGEAVPMTDREIELEWDRHYLPGKAKGAPFLQIVVGFARHFMGNATPTTAALTDEQARDKLLAALIQQDAIVNKVLIAGGDYGDELSDPDLRAALKKAQRTTYQALLANGVERVAYNVNPLREYLASTDAMQSPITRTGDAA